MDKRQDPQSREERLAAKLRENLHRRKAQARALGTIGCTTASDTAASIAENDSGSLPNAAPES
ncbi:hypothetical protein HNO88_001255 [Novosphingobium chloroacetimidivorans]|uniref:Uncharacterized protein n=1 Tax=Novosphingobium chloroacetimidivorans TaxID=1428314 RepID=A0A7W7K8M4_9SPHN|nr:hypothetical protein [Novosphingobium chloroacetimidivorans]MBB4857941.1 hypothetical protein [Novosphingobium chloroacetimidivorans]